jgi:hypothetical protein
MAVIANLLVKVAADTAEIKTAAGDLTKFTNNFASEFAKATVATDLLERGLSLVGHELLSTIDSWSSAQQAQATLTAALRAQGAEVGPLRNQYNALATELENTTVNGDDLYTEMEALLIQIGNVAPEQMRRALQASADLSAGVGIDLKTATTLVGKALAGETGTLSRYGIVLDETARKADPAAAALDAINQKFGGQAAAQAETYAGKVSQLANSYDNLKESIGGLAEAGGILPAVFDAVNAKLKDTTARIEKEKDFWRDVGGWFHAVGVEAGFASTALPKVTAPMRDVADSGEQARAAYYKLRVEAELLRTQALAPLTDENVQLVRAFTDAGLSAD